MNRREFIRLAAGAALALPFLRTPEPAPKPQPHSLRDGLIGWWDSDTGQSIEIKPTTYRVQHWDRALTWEEMNSVYRADGWFTFNFPIEGVEVITPDNNKWGLL